jgi:hypothetical protein
MKGRITDTYTLVYTHTHTHTHPRTHTHIAPAAFVRSIDWIDNIWPSYRKVASDFPKVRARVYMYVCVCT